MVSLSTFSVIYDTDCTISKKQKELFETDAPKTSPTRNTQPLCMDPATTAVYSQCPLYLARVAVQIGQCL